MNNTPIVNLGRMAHTAQDPHPTHEIQAHPTHEIQDPQAQQNQTDSEEQRAQYIHGYFIRLCKSIRNTSTCIKYQTSAIIAKGTELISSGTNVTCCEPTCCGYWQHKYDEYQLENGDDPFYLTFAEWIRTPEVRQLHSQWSARNEIHAEVNALSRVALNDVTDDMVLYTYYSPCVNCAVYITWYKIKTVIYVEVYPGQLHKQSGIKLLEENGIVCKRFHE